MTSGESSRHLLCRQRLGSCLLQKPAPAVPSTFLPNCCPCRSQLGSLKVCSRSLFFVPRDVQQPIFRVPYEATSAIEA